MPSKIREIKTRLDGSVQHFDCDLLQRGPGEVIVRYTMPGDMLLEDVLLPRGTVSVGYFTLRQDFNVYHWVDDDLDTLALYFNICDNTRIDDDHVAWRDLTVDLLITPDYRCRVLDEDELPDDLEPTLKAYIDRARDRLRADAKRLLASYDARSRALLEG